MKKDIKALVLMLVVLAFFRTDPGWTSTVIVPESIDTVIINNLARKGSRMVAASYILNHPALKQDKNAGARWLEAAIFSAWLDTTSISSKSFKNFENSGLNRFNNPEIRANCLLYESLRLSATGLNNQAADSLTASIAVRPAQGTLNRLLLADSYGKLARLYKKTGDLFESSRNFSRSISLNRVLGRPEILAEDLSDLSSVISMIDKSDRQADSVLTESLKIYKALDTLPAVAQVYNELGVLSNRRGNFEESLNFFKQSLNVKYKSRDSGKQEFDRVINNIGHCYQDLGKTDSALFYFSKAVDYALISKKSPARYYINLGAIYGGKEEHGKAIEYFQKALNCFDPACSLTDLSTNPGLDKVTPELAEFTAYKAHGYHRRYHQQQNPADLVNGLNTFMAALEMMDTLRFMYSFESKPYLSSGAKIHFFNALDMALDLFKNTGDQKYLQQAFQLSERNKSATLNEFLRTNQARDYLGNVAPWIRSEDSIKQIINKTQSKLIRVSSGTEYPPDSITAVRNRLLDLSVELKNIGNQAKQDNPQYFRMIYTNNGYLPEEIQKLLNPAEALMDYTVVHDGRLGKDYMIIIVMTRDTLFTFRDTLPNHFRQDISDFRSSITSYVDTKVFHDFSRLSNLMYEYFFKPVEKFRGINQLIILPDEDLGFIPFEVFVSDTIKPKGSDFRKLSYLNRRYQISYISSHEQFYQFRFHRKTRPKSTIYAFAPFVTSGAKMDTLNLMPLGNSGKEVVYISQSFKTRIYENRKATEESLRRAFQDESVVSLSTHGIMSLNDPMQSRLLLYPAGSDGSLYLFEMLSLRINSSLVILNACNTGTGKMEVGEGILSMARGFQFAGVPSVITSLWPIDDQSSATVTKYFFRNLKDGLDQREALMKARNTFIDEGSKAAGAPYFWAGQVLIGDPGTIEIYPRTHRTLLIAALAFVAVILTLLALYFKKTR